MLIAQLSDVHLRADGTLFQGQFDSEARLGAAVDHINRLDPPADIVLATGDLTDDGLAADYALLRRHLDRLKAPYYVIPGNHDDRDRLRSAFLDLGYLPADGPFLHYVRDDYALRLIGLDTVLPGEVGGAMCGARLDWLARQLAAAPDRPTLIFMHHPPFPTGIRFMDRPAFEGAAELAALIRSSPQVRQVVCGHLHRPIFLGWAGTAAAIAPSTVCEINLALKEGVGFAPDGARPAIALYLWENGLGPIGHVSHFAG